VEYQIEDGVGGQDKSTLDITVRAPGFDPEYDHRPGPTPGPQPGDRPGDDTTAETRLRPLNPLKGNQVKDPSVFFEGTVSNKVPRMPIPFHPIVYVNREVVIAQAEREHFDSRATGRT